MTFRKTAYAVTFLIATGGAARAGSYEVLYNFSGPDGTSPTGLIQNSDGKLYGVAALGGDTGNLCAPDGCGTVFRLDGPGQLTTLHTFEATDGFLPSGLIKGKNGILYGSAASGGQPSGGGAGVVFSIAPNGTFKALYAFTGGFACCDGASPTANPILLKDGKLYGTTRNGGDFRDDQHQGGFGTVYQVDPKSGQATILHSFNIQNANGIHPNGPLLLGSDGLLYGTTSEGGTNGGTLFKIDTAGNFSLVAQLPKTQPLFGVVRGQNGSLYGAEEGSR